MQEIVNGLKFPEGPIAMPDGSVILVEIARGTLTRVWDGKTEVIADLGGGPNGAAIGPDGMVYVCNNGGFSWHDLNGLLVPGDRPDDYTGGSIQRVDPASGKFDTLYTECDGNPLCGPNDIVFDAAGGFWFTDLGKAYDRQRDRGALYYAKPDGSMIKEAVFPMLSPNGVGLSPDDGTVYVADTDSGRLWSWAVTGEGEVDNAAGPIGWNMVMGSANYQMFDSLAVDSAGYVCVATLLNGGITRVSPDGATIQHIPTGDPLTTNICFGNKDLKTAYITLSGTGRLVSCEWEVPGHPLHFLNS
jgi:gluconolactonase